MWINRKQFNAVKEQVDQLNKALVQAAKEIASFEDAAILTGIERVGNTNKFTFMRNGKQVVIETYGTISDALPIWKQELLR